MFLVRNLLPAKPPERLFKSC